MIVRKFQASAPKTAEKLCSCIKKVRKTVKVRKGTPDTLEGREQAAIGICVRSVIQGKKKRRTIKNFSCRNTPTLITQKKYK